MKGVSEMDVQLTGDLTIIEHVAARYQTRVLCECGGEVDERVFLHEVLCGGCGQILHFQMCGNMIVRATSRDYLRAVK
jgi:hypothetical protein